MIDAIGEIAGELPIEIMLVFHTILGATAAIVASQKGRDWRLWVPLGLVCGTPALIVAILMEPLSPR